MTYTRRFQLEEADLGDRLVQRCETVLIRRDRRVPQDQGILRRRMIDGLGRHRPETIEEFIRTSSIPALLEQTPPNRFVEMAQIVALVAGEPVPAWQVA